MEKQEFLEKIKVKTYTYYPQYCLDCQNIWYSKYRNRNCTICHSVNVVNCFRENFRNIFDINKDGKQWRKK